MSPQRLKTDGHTQSYIQSDRQTDGQTDRWTVSSDLVQSPDSWWNNGTTRSSRTSGILLDTAHGKSFESVQHSKRAKRSNHVTVILSLGKNICISKKDIVSGGGTDWYANKKKEDSRTSYGLRSTVAGSFSVMLCLIKIRHDSVKWYFFGLKFTSA